MDEETARTLLKDAVSGRCPAAGAPATASPASSDPTVGAVRRRRRRPVLWCALALVFAIGLGAGFAVLRLTQGPLRIDGMSERVAAAIAASIGPGWRVDLRDSALELDAESALALRVAGLDVFNPDGALVVRAPLAVVSLDTGSLLRLSVQPRSIEFRDLQMTALVHRDGSIAFAASSPQQAGAAEPHTLPSVDAARGTVSPISAAVASIFGVVLDRAGVIGALDRARITDGRLILIDDAARQRAVFESVNGLFRRDAVRDARVFELRIAGPHGEWRFGGDLHEAGGNRRTGTITLDDLPITDLLLLSGQSTLPIETDLKLSGKSDVALDGGRIETMTGEVHTSAGSLLIDEKDFNPVTVDGLKAEASWDEAARALKLDSLDYRGAGNAMRLTGGFRVSPPGSDSAWSLSLDGRDAVLRGAAASDAPVRIAALSGRLTGRAGGISIDALTLRGDGLNGSLTGTVGTSADDDGITLHITASDTEGRLALRLWPENIAPAVRTYLVDQLRGGRLDSTDITVDMSGSELAAATRGDPMPDRALRIAFAVSEAGLAVSGDAPPLTRARVSGVITGRGTTIQGATAEIRMGERGLTLTDGGFVIRDPQPDRVTAQVGLRLGGGADALAALLETPMFRSLTGADIDPAAIRGRADLRIDFPLDLKHVPDVADLPVTLSGTLADLSLDRAVGKDRFESGRFALAYERGGFTLKGDGRILGAPVAIDLRQPKVGAPGEAVVTLGLDEALRARKGLPVAPGLAGTIPTRFVVPIGRPGPGRPPIRVEADLARAGIDGLLPGWSKPPGKPGRLAFTLVDTGNGGYDLRDIALDAAPALARGTATISAEGGIERADLSQLKLSPGDDMRVGLDRTGSGYRVSVKGAVADARPFLKAMTGGDGKADGKADGKSGRDGSAREIEADVVLGVLAGHSGENLTNAGVKLTLRGGEVRAAQVKGNFGAARLTASVVRAERGAPLLTLESADAGATLRFLDIYKRMIGGRVALSIALADGPQAGVVQIRDFALRGEPALSSIMAQSPVPADTVDAKGRRHAAPTNANDVEFDRMRANFSRNGARVSFTDAAISNPAMGFTMSGWLDTAREQTAIDGTFVPLYGLNNIVSQVPLFGTLLGGGHNEGLFAVNFAVTGPIAKPAVSVNPLSAVAPGILRKLFGAGGGGDALATGAVPVAPER